MYDSTPLTRREFYQALNEFKKEHQKLMKPANPLLKDTNLTDIVFYTGMFAVLGILVWPSN